MTVRRLVPDLILQQHAAGKARGHFRAAALFVDISGFTKLTETLMQHAKDGAEVLTDVLNDIFGPVVAEVYRQGGFISTFAGDAFTALFPMRRRHACDRAVQTAFFIGDFFTAHRQVSTRYGEFTLAVKLGLALGDADWGIWGAENLHTFYFRGSAIDDSATSEHHASAGQIVATGAVLASLQGAVEAAPLDDHFLLSAFVKGPVATPKRLPAVDLASLRQFFSETVIDLPQRAEFRDVCSVFISFEGDADEATLDAFATAALSGAHRYGGYFNKVDFGDKGGVALVLFGAPVAHEDNVRRALDFVLALQTETKGLQWRAGLTFGTVYAGIIGAEERCEYTAIGDVVNLSARLMMKAEWGDVWLSAPTYEVLKSLHEFDDLGPHTFKGKAEAQRVYRWRRHREATGARFFEGQLIGREQELAVLEEFVTPIFGPAGGAFAGVAYVFGEPGIGKSRLVYELRQRLLAGSAMRWAFCPAEGVLRQSLNPFAHFLRNYFAQSAEQPVDENKARFESGLQALMDRLPSAGADTAELVRELDRTRSMLGALLNLYWAGSLYEMLEPKLRFANTLTALVTLFKAESRVQPLVIEVDDGHVLDVDSQALLELLVRDVEGYPIAVVIDSRYADDGSKALFSFGSGVPVTVIDLGELSRPGIKAFAGQVLDAPVGEDVVALLAERTNGNPFFIEQLALDLRERRLLAADPQGDGHLHLAAAQSAEVPASITAVLISRLDRLAADVKQVVQTASVLGREFELSVLARMVAQWLRDDMRFRHNVAVAETQDVWLPLAEMRYIFKHALMRDSAYDMQLRARLRDLHLLAAQVIELVHADELTAHYVDLAHHYEQASEAAKAQFYLLRAADFTKANYQNTLALSLYERLLKYLAAGDPLRVYVHEQAGDIYTNTGEYDQALERYQQGTADLQAVSDDALVATKLPDLYRKVGSVFTSKGDYEVALSWLQRAEGAVREPTGADMARIHTATAGVLYRQGKANDALEKCQSGLDLASALDARRDLAHAYRLRGTIHTGLGMLDEAVEDYDLSLDLIRALGDLVQQTRADNSLGAVYYYKGDWDQAVIHYRRSLEVAEQIGDVDQRATVANNLGEIYLIRGQFAEAAGQFENCLATWRRTGFRLGVALSHYNLAQTRVYRKEWRQALDHLEQSLLVLGELGSRDWLAAEVHRLLAEVRLGQGQWEAAWDECQLSLQIATSQELKLVEGNARRVLGHWYGVQHRWEEAERELRASLELAQSLGMRMEQGQALVELALLYTLEARLGAGTGPDIDRVEDLLRQAAALFRELGAEWHLANAQALMVNK